MLRRVIQRILADRRERAVAPTVDAGEYERELEAARAALGAGDLVAAERHGRSAVRFQPESPEALRLHGSILGQQGHLPEARAALESALALDARDPRALGDLGNVLRMSGDEAQAAVLYDRALALNPDDRTIRLNRVSLMRQRGLDEAALAEWLALDGPATDPASLKWAVAMLDRLERTEEARALCTRLLSTEPEHAQALAMSEFLAHKAVFQRALDRLRHGDFEHGWIEYELRMLSEDPPVRDLGVPRWRGEDLAGRSLLVYAEQGIGDEIMFASCLPDVMARARDVIVDCSPKLAGLFRRSFPGTTIHGGEQCDAADWMSALGRIDYAVPAGSLPLHFRNSLRHFPRHGGYLRADPVRVIAWERRLARLGPGRKIGISWSGGTARSRQPARSIPLPALASVISTPGAQFVSLQYDGRGDEVHALERETGLVVHHWPEALVDYEETAALVTALDLVVSVCTAVIHLGGALGRQVWVLAPFAAEWRYGDSGESMPWYPSVRVFRQPRDGDWASVVAAVTERLRTLQVSNSAQESAS